MSQNFEDSVQNIKRTILNHNKAMPQPKNQRVIKFDVAQNVHNVHPIQQHALPSKFLKISSNYRIRCCKIVLDSMLPYLVVYVRMLLKGNSHFPGVCKMHSRQSRCKVGKVRAKQAKQAEICGVCFCIFFIIRGAK